MQNAKCKMQNEQRLIAYEAVYQYAFKGVHGGGLEDENFNAIINAIDSVPTVDAVEVVRCKDCIYATEEDGDLYCDGPIGIFGTVGFNDFCSCGERRSNG